MAWQNQAGKCLSCMLILCKEVYASTIALWLLYLRKLKTIAILDVGVK